MCSQTDTGSFLKPPHWTTYFLLQSWEWVCSCERHRIWEALHARGKALSFDTMLVLSCKGLQSLGPRIELHWQVWPGINKRGDWDKHLFTKHPSLCILTWVQKSLQWAYTWSHSSDVDYKRVSVKNKWPGSRHLRIQDFDVTKCQAEVLAL